MLWKLGHVASKILICMWTLLQRCKSYSLYIYLTYYVPHVLVTYIIRTHREKPQTQNHSRHTHSHTERASTQISTLTNENNSSLKLTTSENHLARAIPAEITRCKRKPVSAPGVHRQPRRRAGGRGSGPSLPTSPAGAVWPVVLPQARGPISSPQEWGYPEWVLSVPPIAMFPGSLIDQSFKSK